MLTDFLLNLKENQNFDYNYIFIESKNSTCGCALGWSTFIPEFKEAGLYASSDGCIQPNNKEVIHYRIGYRTDHHDYKDSMLAAARFFGITMEQAEFLFIPTTFYEGRYSPEETASAKDVAEHILEFVAEYS